MRASPPIWVINLKRSENRRKLMENQFTEYGQNIEFIEAIDGRLLTRRDMEIYSQMLSIRHFGRELSLAEIGCALSHIRIWKRIVEEKLNEVLICEDDIKFDESLFGVIRNRDRFPDDYDHLNLSTYAAKLPFGETIYDKYKASHYEGKVKSCAAYLLTYRGACKLLENVFPICMPVDIYIPRSSSLQSYGVYPRLVEYVNLENTIVPTGNYDIPIRKRNYYLLHKFKSYLYQAGIHLGMTPKKLNQKIIQIKHKWNNILSIFSDNEL